MSLLVMMKNGMVSRVKEFILIKVCVIILLIGRVLFISSVVVVVMLRVKVIGMLIRRRMKNVMKRMVSMVG